MKYGSTMQKKQIFTCLTVCGESKTPKIITNNALPEPTYAVELVTRETKMTHLKRCH